MEYFNRSCGGPFVRYPLDAGWRPRRDDVRGEILLDHKEDKEDWGQVLTLKLSTIDRKFKVKT
jgi:hypothetical protein